MGGRLLAPWTVIHGFLVPHRPAHDEPDLVQERDRGCQQATVIGHACARELRAGRRIAVRVRRGRESCGNGVAVGRVRRSKQCADRTDVERDNLHESVVLPTISRHRGPHTDSSEVHHDERLAKRRAERPEGQLPGAVEPHLDRTETEGSEVDESRALKEEKAVRHHQWWSGCARNRRETES